MDSNFAYVELRAQAHLRLALKHLRPVVGLLMGSEPTNVLTNSVISHEIPP